MVNLSLTEKGGNTSELSFDKDEVTVGRVRGNDVVLPKGNVSKHHCRLVKHGGEMFVEDLHSTNGTYVNGRKIAEPTPLSASDKVFVGDFILRLTSLAASLEMRPASPPGPPEAGSLSSAIPRRPPPPPPPIRSSAGSEEGKAGRSPLPPPPPPPPPLSARSGKAGPTMTGDTYSPTSGPSDINLDDEDDGTPQPHITVPPLKPAVQPAGTLGDVETPHGAAEQPGPGRGHGALTLGHDDVSPPEPPSNADEDVVEPPAADAQEIFPTPPERGHGQRAHDAKSIEPGKGGKPAHAPAKPAGRQVDRDLPDWLAHLLEGENVTAVFLTGTNQIEVQRNGRREPANVPSADLNALPSIVRKLAAKGAPKPAAEASTVNTTLPDGLHVAAIFPPVADRLCVAIRRPVAAGKTIDDLVEDRVISKEMRQVLDAAVATRQNIVVSGDRAACDSILRALLWSVDRMAHVVLLSESITPPASASSWVKLQPAPGVSDLVGAALALQPEYIVIDASHGSLAGEVLSECSAGLKGAIVSVVARSTNDALRRVQVLGAQGLPAAQSGDLVTSSIDVLVQASVLSDGSLKIIEIAEPKSTLDGQVSSHALLTWIPGEDGLGSFTVTGARSALAAKLSSAGNSLPTEILNHQ